MPWLRSADAEAVRLDAMEAPQRELAAQKQHDADDQALVLDKARSRKQACLSARRARS